MTARDAQLRRADCIAMRSDRPALTLRGLRVFISYPRGGMTHTWAERVHAYLQARGAEVWRDERSIEQGDADWYARIREALEGADVVASIVGLDSEGSKWQQREMLKADELALPVVPFRTARVALPLYMNERQPVELIDASAPEASFDKLARALAAAAPRRPAAAQAKPIADAQRRERELAYLRTLLSGDLSQHEERYEPVAGTLQRQRSLARTHKGLRIDTAAVMRAFAAATTGALDAAVRAEPEKTYTDILDAYRALPQQRVRRLAVLGEPGAGKSFSLERIACDYARAALRDAAAPLPLLVRLGFWTREGESLDAFVERQLGDLGRDVGALRDEGRAVLLLDGLNEIPPSQRVAKVDRVRAAAEDDRHAAVIVSCRERDFGAGCALPFDTLTLQPLTPLQIHRFLRRACALQDDGDAGGATVERRFWQIAGAALHAVWLKWEAAGASFEMFWTADEVSTEEPNVFSETSFGDDELWREARHGTGRNLISLAANPYLLVLMLELMERFGSLPSNRARLFDGFLQVLHERERNARAQRHDDRSVPDERVWHAALTDLAEAMQRLDRARRDGEAADAATTLRAVAVPASMSAEMIDFSIDASVLQRAGAELRFSHQLLQEALASRVLREASRSGARAAADFWPAARWWERSGWEVVAEIAAEACEGDSQALPALIGWLAEANPEVACQAWQRAGAPALPPELDAAIEGRWLARLTDAALEPAPAARAAIGRALGGFGLDRRRGAGLRADGLPDIDWVRIEGGPFVYQDGERRTLPAFEIARYPVTNRQFQAFIAAGGYAEGRWWTGLAQRIDAPSDPRWSDANAPRETVSWYEAVAYCRWLSAALGCEVRLPTEVQWERAARGTAGFEYPWGDGYRAGCANCDEPSSNVPNATFIGRTTSVGIYPYPSPDGVHDLAGNVWEWCLNEHGNPERTGPGGDASRVLRGGSWSYEDGGLRAAVRNGYPPGGRGGNFGFRLCRSSPIEKRSAGARSTGPRKR